MDTILVVQHTEAQVALAAAEVPAAAQVSVLQAETAVTVEAVVKVEKSL